MAKRQLSLCALAMLVAIIDRDKLHVDELLRALPPGVWVCDEWPADVAQWFDELQTLLDAGFVVRIEEHKSFKYAFTRAGKRYADVWIHPIVDSMESVA